MNNFSWAEIEQIGQSGLAQQVFSIGDTKDISVSGETITVEIYGFNHDDLQNGGKASYTFGMRDLMANTRQMNTSQTNVGGFTGSAMYSYLNTTLYNQLPADLRSVIKQVNKKTSAGNTSTAVNADTMRLWLPSLNEVYGSHSYSWCSNNEGIKYSIFTNDASRIKNMSNGSGSASLWWLRSPSMSHSTSFCVVYNNGGVGNTNSATRAYGVCFGFCV